MASGLLPLLLHLVVVSRAHLVGGEAGRVWKASMQIPRAPAAFARWYLAFSRQWSDHDAHCLRLTSPTKISAMTATRAIIRRTVNLGRVRRMAHSWMMSPLGHR